MSLVVREMAVDEVDLIIDYFHSATPEHLELVGVDPARLPGRRQWREHYIAEEDKPRGAPSTLLLVWGVGREAGGFFASGPAFGGGGGGLQPPPRRRPPAPAGA